MFSVIKWRSTTFKQCTTKTHGFVTDGEPYQKLLPVTNCTREKVTVELNNK